MFGPTHAFPFGRAEPAPPRGGLSELGWPSGESPEMTRRVVFSEGHGLRVREYGPYASPRYVTITERQATARWPSGDMPG